MTNLSQVVGNLITQINKGRAQGDSAVLEIANIYKDNPILSEFPIPRMSLDSVEVDLKVVIDSKPIPSTSLTEKSKIYLMKQLKTMLHTLIEIEPSINKLVQKSPKFKEHWHAQENKILKEFSHLFTTGIDVQPELHAKLATSIVMNHFLNMIIAARSELDPKNVPKFLDGAKLLENSLKTRIEKTIHKALPSQLDDENDFKVLITSSELENVSPETITTVKLNLRESDRNWVITNEKKKLVPY